MDTDSRQDCIEKTGVIEITPEMVEAGCEAFWDFAEDRYSVLYDPAPMVTQIFSKMAVAQGGHKEHLDGGTTPIDR